MVSTECEGQVLDGVHSGESVRKWKKGQLFSKTALMAIREMRWPLKADVWSGGYFAFKTGEITAYLYADEPMW